MESLFCWSECKFYFYPDVFSPNLQMGCCFSTGGVFVMITAARPQGSRIPGRVYSAHAL